MAVTDDRGAAVLGLAAEGPLQLFARPLASRGAPAIVVGTCSSADPGVLEFELPADVRSGSLSLTVDDPLADRASARAWRLDSGEGVMLQSGGGFDGSLGGAGTSSEHATRLFGRLLPGRWRVELRAPGRAWTEIGEFDLAPGENLELGRVLLPPTGSFVLNGAEPKETLRLSLRSHVDGAVVVWPERVVAMPATLETLPDVRVEILRRTAGEDDRPATLPFGEPLRPTAGRQQTIALPGAR
jgi:hypothetical protein